MEYGNDVQTIGNNIISYKTWHFYLQIFDNRLSSNFFFSLVLKHSVDDHRWQQNQTVTFNERTTVQRKRSVSNKTIFNDDHTVGRYFCQNTDQVSR